MALPQARSQLTRHKLIEAAIESLIESGLAGTATAAVAARAGMSQGALFKHFPSKSALLAATVEAILQRLVAEFAREAAPHADLDTTLHQACALLWRIFRNPAMRAVFEVFVAARTDADLAARLAPILERHRAAILREAARLLPAAAAAGPDFEGAVDAVVYAMQGAAIGLFAPDPDREVEHLAFLERLAHRELARLGGR